MQNQSDNGNDKVEIINVINTIKKRAVGIHGKETDEGFFELELIEAADKEIKASCGLADDIIKTEFKKLIDAWDKIKTLQTNDPLFIEIAKKMFINAHNIKDIAGQCGFTLISFFSESLRDFLDEKASSVRAQKVIIQAHIDAINVCHINGYKEEAGAKAEELKAMVKKAIDQYT